MIKTATFYVLGLFLAINLTSFGLMFWDKRQSRLAGRRVSESALFLLAFLFGALGIYFGMFFWRHKTQRWYFIVGIPLLIIFNIYLLFRGLILYLTYYA